MLSKPHSAASRHEVLKGFEQAFDGDPRSVDAKYGIANVLTSNVLDGWALLLSRIKHEPNNCLSNFSAMTLNSSDAHANMGMLRRAQGRPNDVRIEPEIAIGLAPNNIQAMGQLGITLTFLGHPEAAVPLIELCLRLAPTDRNTPVNQAIVGLCKLLLAMQMKPSLGFGGLGRLILGCSTFTRSWRRRLHCGTNSMRPIMSCDGRMRPEFGSKSDLEAVLREITLEISLFAEDGLCRPYSRRSPSGSSQFCSPAR